MRKGRYILRVLVTLSLAFKYSRSEDPCADLDPDGCRANPHLCRDPLLAEVTCPVTCRTGCALVPTTTLTAVPIHPASGVVGGHVMGHSTLVTDTLVHFNDSGAWNHGRITGIRMQCGQYLLAMLIQYNDVWAPKHGFWTDNCATNTSWTPFYYFGKDEWIQHAELTGSWYTSSVTFTTNKRRLETCGVPEAGAEFREGGRLEYVFGVFGCYFDSLQLHWSSYVSL
ncbi:uncharacterized protein LOC128242582 [Mya arenaria]|uniref:uncharacterized protein LOC128242582 n=1 Tax=Mya arenaria TaxID=6604 RepID=UPI0022E177E7|nr:uncharacterized protein LOC128242582 [Mya arenaria]